LTEKKKYYRRTTHVLWEKKQTYLGGKPPRETRIKRDGIQGGFAIRGEEG